MTPPGPPYPGEVSDTPYSDAAVRNKINPWRVYVDGSATNKSSGAGVIIESPDGTTVEQAIHFAFAASNNQAEYEALIAGLVLAKDLGATQVRLHSDSQLVVNRLNGDFEAKDLTIIKYLEHVKKLMSRFKSVLITRIPRNQNARANILSKLAHATGYNGLRTVLRATRLSTQKTDKSQV